MIRILKSNKQRHTFSKFTRLLTSKVDETPNTKKFNHIKIINFDDRKEIPLPVYERKLNEPLKIQKQRLIYQSRKRGMLENDLLLSTFAAKYLPNMDAKHTNMYDDLINGPSNDWDIYYWAVGTKPIPEKYNNEIMQMLIKHVKNESKQKRLQQPSL